MSDREYILAAVDGGFDSGRLSASGRLVEYTGGSTGISLAFICASRGIPVTVVTSDAFSQEKRDHMRATVATLVCDSGLKYLTTKLYAERQDAGPGH